MLASRLLATAETVNGGMGQINNVPVSDVKLGWPGLGRALQQSGAWVHITIFPANPQARK